MNVAVETGAGRMIREWRIRRRMSQLDLALEAEISQRHLSFLESGRSSPSRAMVLRLAEHLEVPLRQRNRLLMAAGFAPGFSERGLDEPSLRPALSAVEAVLKAHEPCPALAIDRHWNLVMANRALTPFLSAADPSLLSPPVNVLRLSLHPKGLAPSIANLAEWREHLFARLGALIAATADAGLEALEKELRGYPTRPGQPPPRGVPAQPIATPLRLRVGDAVYSFISTTTVFGTPLDVTLSELAIEAFFPADEETAVLLRRNLDA